MRNIIIAAVALAAVISVSPAFAACTGVSEVSVSQGDCRVGTPGANPKGFTGGAQELNGVTGERRHVNHSKPWVPKPTPVGIDMRSPDGEEG